MGKPQLALGLTSSIVILAALWVLTLLAPDAITASTYALIGWVSGMAGLFVAGSSE